MVSTGSAVQRFALAAAVAILGHGTTMASRSSTDGTRRHGRSHGHSDGTVAATRDHTVLAEGCELAIVGAGPGGVFTAWRLAVDTNTIHPSSICVFERSSRVGGRTFSLRSQGPKKDLLVELGAYRFCGVNRSTNCDGCEMCMPMMNNLIAHRLGFPTMAYEPHEEDKESKLVKIVDKDGHNAGLLSYVERMFNESSAAGVRFYFDAEVGSLEAMSSSTGGAESIISVVLSNGTTAAMPNRVLLNTPLIPTSRIVRNSPSLVPHFDNGEFPDFLKIPHVYRHVKFYVHYSWAWWRALNLTSGYFTLYGPTPGYKGGNDSWDGMDGCSNNNQVAQLAPCSADTLPLEGRYHDGDYRCEGGDDLNCRGYIEATYTSDGVHGSNVTFFELYQTATDPPFVHVDNATSSDGAHLLSLVHERLLTAHASAISNAGPAFAARIQPPDSALLSMWDPRSPGFGAGTHGMGFGKTPGGAYAPGAAAGTVAAKAIKPMKSLDLYIANEAFHPADWGEASLEMAENVCAKFFQVAAPKWVPSTSYADILFGSPDAPPPGPPGPRPPPPPSPAPPSGCDGVPLALNGTHICVCTPDDATVTLKCASGLRVAQIVFASIGLPSGACGSYERDAKCDGAGAVNALQRLCVGKPECTFEANIDVLNGGHDPCTGVPKHTSVQLRCSANAPPAPPSPPPPSPGPPPSPPGNTTCSGPHGAAVPAILRNRPSGTALPDFLTLAAPFTPFNASGGVDTAAVSALAQLFKRRLGITAVWVMGMRGQFDTLTVQERKEIAAAWIAAGKAEGLFTIIHVGSTSVMASAELAAHAESISADAIAAVGPYEELCADTQCVVNFVGVAARAASKTPFFYYHTPGWNGKSLNNVKMYDFFRLANTSLGNGGIPTLVGVKFESYNDAEFAQTCAEWGSEMVMIYAPCNSLGHWTAGQPGRGAFIQALFAPSCNRIRAAWERSDDAGMRAEIAWQQGCNLPGGPMGGNSVERYFYQELNPAAGFGDPRLPQSATSASTVANYTERMRACGLFNQSWPSG